MKNKTLLILLISIVCFSCNIKDSRPSDEKLKQTIYSFIDQNRQYICPSKNFNKAYKRSVKVDKWNGVFENSKDEYAAKIIIRYDDCWKKKKKEPVSFLFHKNTDGKWVMDKIVFEMSNEFTKAPGALREWYKSVSTKFVTVE